MGFLDTIKGAFAVGDDYDDREDYEEYEDSRDSRSSRKANDDKVNRSINITATAQLQVILVKPEKYSDTKQIADHLNDKKNVVLNLESTTPDVTRRIIDFLGGVAYANGGNIKPIANNTFIITPYNVGFVGEDLVGELENNGVFFDR